RIGDNPAGPANLLCRQVNGEGGALARLGTDRKPGPVPRQYMLDDGQPKPSAFLGAACFRLDPVKALRKAGNILFRNASAEISYRNVHGRPGGLSSFGAGDDDTPACSAVFARILDQVLEYLEHFIFIAGENELTVA